MARRSEGYDNAFAATREVVNKTRPHRPQGTSVVSGWPMGVASALAVRVSAETTLTYPYLL